MTQEPPDDIDAGEELPAEDEEMPPEEAPPGEGAREPEDLASVVYVERTDDVASVCGRIDTAPTYWVILHAPRGNRTLSTELGMRRIKRHAEESGRVVAFATGSPSLISRARQMGIPAARRPEAVRWHSGSRTVLSLGRGRALVLPRLGRYVQWLVLLGVIALAGGLILTMVPSATVVAYPPTQTVSVTTVITGSSEVEEVDIDARIVPSTEISTSHVFTLTQPATGSETVPGERATATVELTNPTGEAVTVEQGTLLLGAPGLLAFATDETVVVEPGASATVTVTATEGGDQFNVEAGAITGWFDEELRVLTATNPEPATGGGDAEVPLVTAQDVIAIREAEAALERSDAVRKLIAEENPGDAIFLESLAVTGEEVGAPPEAGTQTDMLIVQFRITVTGLAIADEHIRELARGLLAEQAGEAEFVEGSVRAVELGGESFDPESGDIEAEFELSAEFADGVTAAEVTDAVKGKSPSDAEAALMEDYGIEEAEVSLTPGFAPWVPRFDFRIEVEFRVQEAEEPPDDDSEQPDDEDTTDDGA